MIVLPLVVLATATLGGLALHNRTDSPAAQPLGEVSGAFLDLLAPVAGDSGARADELARILLAEAQAESAADCMVTEGYAAYRDFPLLNAQDFVRAQSYFTAPAEIKARGLVTVGDPALELVPLEARQASSRCLATDSNATAQAVDQFIVFRDGTENPFGDWHETVVAETQRIAASEESASEPYRACFQDVGVPADIARNPMQSIAWLIRQMNERTTEISLDAVEAWKRGERVLDVDAGATANATAHCLELFEPLLTPRLLPLRDDIFVSNRGAVLHGNALFEQAIGALAFDPASYTFGLPN